MILNYLLYSPVQKQHHRFSRSLPPLFICVSHRLSWTTTHPRWRFALYFGWSSWMEVGVKKHVLVSAFRVRNKSRWSSNFADSLIIIAESRNWTGSTPILTKKIDSINYDFASFKLWNRCDMNKANEPFRQCIRELKQRKFSGRRRLEWQREAGTDFFGRPQ